ERSVSTNGYFAGASNARHITAVLPATLSGCAQHASQSRALMTSSFAVIASGDAEPVSSETEGEEQATASAAHARSAGKKRMTVQTAHVRPHCRSRNCARS